MLIIGRFSGMGAFLNSLLDNLAPSPTLEYNKGNIGNAYTQLLATMPEHR
jgi:hypothetical protein